METTRDRLVAAGVEIVDESGLGEVGVRAVAARAGVSHGAPRRYFPTLESLLAAIAASGVADVDRVLSPAIERGIAEAAVEYWRFAQRRPGMFELIFRHDLLDGAGEDLRSTTGPWFRGIVAAVGDPDRALTCWAAVHGLCVLAATRVPDAVGVTVDELAIRRIATELGA
ncbi:TetR/AcrR family transcriptional regulator [Gordonia sp. PDNC005]|uniref:TetR/AcrR family transcriptional regulator n=1 Tax=unclassified Gordonia (in: high G+C Gram-positive bacteria) TaxID=2657482 RepID=UPI0019643C21|nr:TetR/AcrR family transcriptional regulator [Gordonia sp. PDNC005]QRY63667.1 TetR/AcrR family transcriptional regulator [Gordonia sp. PDNC005]